ncbi:MAG: nucleotidyltransferase domain-containing protein [Magnetococcales bacterium]|nr:nucleotidyltransferase domain-containing protein [Magnetococcales bacterium]
MNDPLEITPEQHALLCALLQRFLPAVTVLAYGSRVTGGARPYSDLDLVLFATPAQRPLLAELKEALEESNLPFLVELLVWQELPDSFQRTIAARHVVLQGGESDLLALRRDISAKGSRFDQEMCAVGLGTMGNGLAGA